MVVVTYVPGFILRHRALQCCGEKTDSPGGRGAFRRKRGMCRNGRWRGRPTGRHYLPAFCPTLPLLPAADDRHPSGDYGGCCVRKTRLTYLLSLQTTCLVMATVENGDETVYRCSLSGCLLLVVVATIWRLEWENLETTVDFVRCDLLGCCNNFFYSAWELYYVISIPAYICASNSDNILLAPAIWDEKVILYRW